MQNDRRSGDDRRHGAQSSWSDPRVIVAVVAAGVGCFQAFIAVCSFAFVVFAGVVGSFIFLRTSAATSEVSGATINNQLGEIKAQLIGINSKLGDSADANIRQDGKLSEHETRIKAEEEKTSTQIIINADDDKKFVELKGDIKAIERDR